MKLLTFTKYSIYCFSEKPCNAKNIRNMLEKLCILQHTLNFYVLLAI